MYSFSDKAISFLFNFFGTPCIQTWQQETSFHHCAFSNQSFEKYVDVYAPCN